LTFGSLRTGIARGAAALLALFVCSGCHPGLFDASYSVEWPKASNEVRAVGSALLARGRTMWHGEATFDLDPAYFEQKHTERLAATLTSGGYLRERRGHYAFTPRAIAASVPCGEPDELGVDCRRFALGRLSDIRITDYSYQSKTFETGVAFRDLGFVFRIVPATPIARLLEAHGGLVCTVGYKTTKVVLAGDKETSTSPLLRPWTRRLWCEGTLEQMGDELRPATMGPVIPLPDYPAP
jgi:hypothetical protein